MRFHGERSEANGAPAAWRMATIVLAVIFGLVVAYGEAKNAGADEPKPRKSARSFEEVREGLERISGIRFSQTNQRDHDSVKSAFREAVADVRRSIVRVLADDDQVALGTIIDAEGYVLTKASELHGKLTCKLSDGRVLPAVNVGVNREYDLAMLKVEAAGLPQVKWRDGSAPDVGSWLITAGMENLPEAIGVVSASPRKVVAPKGMLGVILEEDAMGARVSQVMPGSAADRVKLQFNDVVTHINGKLVTSRQMLVETIQKFLPGEAVDLRVRRDGVELVFRPQLSDRNAGPQQERAEFQNTLGGKLSERRSGFPLALQHDTVLRPNLCGGPVVDLDGRAVGINIARAGRVASYALTGDVVVPLLAELKSGKLAPPVETMLVDTQKLDSE